MLFELFTLYWIVSIILFFFPKLLHRKKLTYIQRHFLSKGKVVTIAHRGGMLENYDNSMSAFASCAKLKVDMIEMDVHKTKDDRYIVIHDFNLKRITGQDLLVKDIEYNAIEPYLNEIYCDYGLSYSKVNEYREKPCLLEDFFLFIKQSNMMVHLEVKTGHLEDLDKVISMANKYEIADKIVIGIAKSFDPSNCKTKYKEEINFYFPIKEGLWIFFCFFTGLLPFITFKFKFFTLPFNFKSFEKSNLFRIWGKVRIFFVFLSKIQPVISLLMWHLQQRGIPIIYFVANDVEDFELAVKCRANGIMTDRPQKLMDYVNNKDK